jgi:putative redox protein
MKESILVKWTGEMSFEAEVDDHRIALDAKPEVGGRNQGPRPKPLMMVALAGCTGMDVVSLLKKMRVDLEDLNVKVEGELTEEHPRQFTSMHIIYEFRGENLDMDKLKKAIDMSQDKYCGVSATLRKVLNLTYEIKILD